MRTLLGLALSAPLWLGARQDDAPAPAAEPLAELATRQKLRTLTSDVARLGDLALVGRMRDALASLGDDAKALERLARDWERIALAAKPGRSARAATASKLARELPALVEALAEESEPRRSELARAILALDSAEPTANAVLGRELDADGEWLGPDERRWKRGARRVQGLLRAAAALEIEVEHGTSANPALRELCGGGNVARALGVELHSRLPPEKLERILRQALRAGALSRGVLTGALEPPGPRPHAFVLLDSAEQAGPALDQALAAGGIGPEDRELARELDLRSFVDARGWRTARWHSEADAQALILWELVGDWLGTAPQPCLRVGHLSWVCLSFLGTSAPATAWSEEPSAAGAGERSVAKLEAGATRAALWRCARTSLWGTKSWMRAQARAGVDPPWARAMLDQDGKIHDAPLLKTTLACEMLQEEGLLWDLLEATRGAPAAPATFEAALGEPLPELERRWRRWLDPPARGGVLQELQAERAPRGDASGAGDAFATALLALNQARADALAGQHPEIPIVALDADLSRAAEAHARYLVLNPERKARWPDAHEERPDEPGFTPEGALAGSRSLIALTGDPVAAVEAWLGGFYHRLPLLSPGLFGAGLARCEDVVVLDAGSLVVAPWNDHAVLWPRADAVRVPRRFAPEAPNPVPGADMAGLGYPVTVQLWFARPAREVELALALFEGDAGGRPVECHAVSPGAPLEPALAPENAWALIPRAHLAPKTRYTATAAWGDERRTWSFTTGE